MRVEKLSMLRTFCVSDTTLSLFRHLNFLKSSMVSTSRSCTNSHPSILVILSTISLEPLYPPPHTRSSGIITQVFSHLHRTHMSPEPHVKHIYVHYLHVFSRATPLCTLSVLLRAFPSLPSQTWYNKSYIVSTKSRGLFVVVYAYIMAVSTTVFDVHICPVGLVQSKRNSGSRISTVEEF